ncbi:Gfo/Idh/MocA family protein [Magnetococcales bacterium HHB-1]
MLKFGLIGAGYWGKILIRTLDTLPQATLTALASRNPKSGNLVSTDCRIWPDWQAMVQKTDFDGLLVATPPQQHYAMAKAALKRSIPLFLEKPFCSTLEEAEQLFNAIKPHHLIHIDHIDLLNPAWQSIKENLHRIGSIQKVELTFGGTTISRTKTTPLWEWGPHPLALILDLFPKELSIKEIQYQKTKPLHESWQITFQSDQTPIMLDLTTPRAVKSRKVMIQGKKGLLIYNDRVKHKAVLKTDKMHILPVLDRTPVAHALQRFIDTIHLKKKNLSIQDDRDMGLQTMRWLTELEKRGQSD